MDYIQVKARPLDTAIEFKEINPEDFQDDYIIEGNSKTIISPDESGYIGDKLINSINLHERNTVVINAGVGQGKSTECINIAYNYLNQKFEDGSNKYVVIFVAPFISLINQYEKRLALRGISQNDIFNFTNLVNNPDIDLNLVMS